MVVSWNGTERGSARRKPVPVPILLYKLHKNSTMRGRCLIACTTEQLAQNTRSSFSVLKQRAYLQEYMSMADKCRPHIQLLYDLIWFVTTSKFRTFAIFGTAYISRGAVD
jgi:hypothetical protein